MENDGFTFVKKKKGKKNSRTTVVHDVTVRDPIDVTKALVKLKSASDELKTSEFYQKLMILLDFPECENIWCFGLGHIGECVTARYQLAALMLLRQTLKVEKVFVSDPMFYPEEVEILQKLQFTVIQKNLECRVKCDTKTLLYLPHCPKQLTNNLLHSNWDLDGLENLVLLANSFDNILERTSDKMLEKNAKLIKVAVENKLVTEKPLDNCFKYDDVFNDTSLHTFTCSELLDKEFWKASPPDYDPLDTEFIRACKV